MNIKKTVLTNHQFGILDRNGIDPVHDFTLCETLLKHPIDKNLFDRSRKLHDEKYNKPYVSKYTPPTPDPKPVPKCPTCGSTRVKKLDAIDRAVSIGLLGIFSKKINKSFQCKDCGGTW